jgi:hypothetical protein
MIDEIECPKHNGSFDYRNGEAIDPPVCVNLKTYPDAGSARCRLYQRNRKSGGGTVTGGAASDTPGNPYE